MDSLGEKDGLAVFVVGVLGATITKNNKRAKEKGTNQTRQHRQLPRYINRN